MKIGMQAKYAVLLDIRPDMNRTLKMDCVGFKNKRAFVHIILNSMINLISAPSTTRYYRYHDLLLPSTMTAHTLFSLSLLSLPFSPTP